MGASGSAPRRVTVENDVILMSDSVCNRLKSDLMAKKEAKSKVEEESKSESPAAPPEESPPEPRTPPRSSSATPLVQYVEEPSLSALRMKETKEEELRELESYYQKRLNDLRDEHSRIANLTEENFNKSTQKVGKLLMPVVATPICYEARQKLLNCYENNPSQQLLCADSVKSFKNCVQASRLRSG